MERKTKEELCEALAVDYALRAQFVLKLDYKKSYDTYMKRSAFRDYDDILHQYNQSSLYKNNKE